MKVNERTRRVLRVRREARDMTRMGWEYVGEGGGKLWELYRGSRRMHRIIAAQVAADGMGVWVFIQNQEAQRVSA